MTRGDIITASTLSRIGIPTGVWKVDRARTRVGFAVKQLGTGGACHACAQADPDPETVSLRRHLRWETPRVELDRYRAGSGEPLVLLHGIWESWHSWSPVLDRLSAEREVLAPTLPDHLGSPRPDAGAAPTVKAWANAVEAELDSAGFERPDIAGNSLGGWLALELAKRGRARTVVGVAPAGLFTRDEGRAFAKKFRRDHLTIRMLMPLARRLVRTRRGRRLLLADNCVDPARIPPVEAERLVAEFAHCDVAGHLAANTRADGAIARIDGLEQVSCPVLILHPSGDRVLSREHAERFLTGLPNAELRELSDCGHTAMFDNPELVASEILRFTSATHAG